MKMKKMRGWRVAAFAKPGSARFSKFDDPDAKPVRPYAIYENFQAAMSAAMGVALTGGSVAIDFDYYEVPDV